MGAKEDLVKYSKGSKELGCDTEAKPRCHFFILSSLSLRLAPETVENLSMAISLVLSREKQNWKETPRISYV